MDRGPNTDGEKPTLAAYSVLGLVTGITLSVTLILRASPIASVLHRWASIALFGRFLEKP
ncbi:hypothetical protein EBZ39_05675 [bacterium]|nr:hypothetical protein [bacterium]